MTRWQLALLVCGLWLTACSQQPGLLPAASTQASPPSFASSASSSGVSPTAAFASSSIPSGTVITIRLQSPLSSTGSHPGDQFQAVLDDAIVSQGQTLASDGTVVTGTVLAAEASQARAPGYLRLTLSTLALNGKPCVIHTSSVFSKGGVATHRRNALAAEKPDSVVSPANDVQFSTGRRLTFRLIEPLPLHG